MKAITNVENLAEYKGRFSLIVKQILAFDSSPNFVRKVKTVSQNLKQITSRCFTLLKILIRIIRLILSLNSKQFHQTLHLNSLHIVDINCNFL